MAIRLHFIVFLTTLILIQFFPIVAPDPAYNRPTYSLGPCIGAVCGRGRCVLSGNTSLGFECECEEGWRQVRPMGAYFLQFLPCVIPICALNYTCAETRPPREFPNIPYPNTPFSNLPNPNTPYSNNPYQNVPYPNIPYPNTPYPNRPYPNTPIPNIPYENTPNPNRQYPNTPFPNIPFGNTPNSNTPYPNIPFQNTPNPDRQYPNVPYQNTPYPNIPYQNTPRGNRPYNNVSTFDPCYYSDCGGGYCVPTSPFTHSCICREGFANLFNDTVFPCYRQCAFGAGCSSLGINTTTSVLDPNPLLLYGGASLMEGAEFGSFIALLISLATLFCKFNI